MIDLRDILKKVFRFENSYLYPVCAAALLQSEHTLSEDELTRSRDLVRQNTGIFSNFRSMMLMPTACYLAAHGNDTAYLQKAFDLYEQLKKTFRGSEYTALLSLVQIFSHARVDQALRQRCIDFYLSHTAFINNWDLVDLSCYPLLGEWLLDTDRTLLYDLARSGRTVWERRIGIVSTMTFIRHGQTSDTFAIADILLHHPHDLIHKAVGWLLREAGKRDREALERWLRQAPPPAVEDVAPAPGRTSLPRYRQMPRTMLRYAIEKFPEPVRQSYLKAKI